MPAGFVYVGYPAGVFMLLSATLHPALALMFPTWLLALSAIMLIKARAIPREARIPQREPVGTFRPISPDRDDDARNASQ